MVICVFSLLFFYFYFLSFISLIFLLSCSSSDNNPIIRFSGAVARYSRMESSVDLAVICSRRSSETHLAPFTTRPKKNILRAAININRRLAYFICQFRRWRGTENHLANQFLANYSLPRNLSGTRVIL